MYNDTVFQQIARILDFQTFQHGWAVFFLLIIAINAVFKANGLRHALEEIEKQQKELAAQNAELITLLTQLRTATLASYSALYNTARSLEIRASTAASKRGESDPKRTELPTPEEISRNVLTTPEPTRPAIPAPRTPASY